MHNSGKRQITLVAIGVLLLFFLLLGLSLSSRGWLNISAPDKLPDNKEVLVQLSSDDGANSQTITLAAGESKRLWLNKGSWQVTGTAGNVKSIDVVRVKGFSTTQVLTPTGEARQLQQLGSDVGNCITNPAGKLFSYGCESGAQVVASNVSGNYISVNTPLFGGETFNLLKPIKNGLIGFNADFSEVQYLDLVTGNKHSWSAPKGVNEIGIVDTNPELVTSKDPNNTNFVIVSPYTNRLYFYKDLISNSPVEVEPPKGIKLAGTTRIVSVTTTDKSVILFASAYDGQDDGHDIEGTEGVPQADNQEGGEIEKLTGWLLEYNLAGKLQKEIELPTDFEGLFLEKLDNDFYISKDMRGGAEFYWLNDGVMVPVHNSRHVSSWTVLKGVAYIQETSSLYKFIPGKEGTFSLRSLFASDEVSVSSIFAGYDSIIFTGFRGDGDRQFNAYALTDKQQTSGQLGEVEPKYEGFDELFDGGITKAQVDNLRYGLGLYAQASGINAKTLSVTNFKIPSVGRYGNANGLRTSQFDLTINSTTKLKATMEYGGLELIRLKLADSSGKQVYDSGEIK